MILVQKCRKCGGMMEITFDGFCGFDASCIICGFVRPLVKESIPPEVQAKVRQYSVIGTASPTNVHIKSSAIRKASGDIRIGFTHLPAYRSAE